MMQPRIRGLARRVQRHFRRTARRRRSVVWTTDFLEFLRDIDALPDHHHYDVMSREFQERVREYAALYLPDDPAGIDAVAVDDAHPCRDLARVIRTIPRRVRAFPLREWMDADSHQGLDYWQAESLCRYHDFTRESRLYAWYHHLNVYVHRLAARRLSGTLDADRRDLLELAHRQGDGTAHDVLLSGPDFRLTDTPEGSITLQSEPVCPDPDESGPHIYVPLRLAPTGADDSFTFNILWPADDVDLPRPDPPEEEVSR